MTGKTILFKSILIGIKFFEPFLPGFKPILAGKFSQADLVRIFNILYG